MPTKIDFIGGNTKRCLMAMALPMIAAMFLNMMYNLVDSLWIGNLLDETAYAALTNSTPIILILTSVAMGATNGVSILISQAIGAKDKKKAESLIATSFCVAVTFSLLVTILLEIFLPGILKALNTPAETYDMAYSYLAIYILGYLAVYLYLYFTAVLRSFGNSMFQAVAMLVSTILNAVFDPVFIHFIGFHGAAIATLLSQMICLLFMLTYLKKKKLFTFKISAFNCSDVLLLIQKAIPSVIQQSIPAISTTSLVFNEDIIPNTRRDDYEKNSAYKELLSQFTEWANEMSRQIRHRSYERSLTQSDKKFLSDESVTDVDGVDISLGTELDSYDMDDSDSVANTDLLSKLSLLMDMGKKKTKYNVLNLNSKFTVDQKQTLEHVFDALYAKYTNAKANDIIQTIIDSF